MPTHRWISFLTCALLAVALVAIGCNKVRDPEVPDKPDTATSSLDTKTTGDQAPSGPPPVITCDKPEHDFGTVAQGEEAKHTFVVKNTGKGPLKIERARGG